MNELVVHHRYLQGSTFDLSGHFNHGHPNDVAAGPSSYSFAQPDSAITVDASPSLQDVRALRVLICFRVAANAPATPCTLISATDSFWLGVGTGGGVLVGAIKGPDGQWHSVS